jgi:5'-AMP-activated protein kinase regulatory beta subunit
MQVPMVPIAKPGEMGLRGYQQAQALYQQLDLYSEPEWGVPTMILWNHGGSSVSVLGSWDNWSKRYILSPVASSTFFHQLT